MNARAWGRSTAMMLSSPTTNVWPILSCAHHSCGPQVLPLIHCTRFMCPASAPIPNKLIDHGDTDLLCTSHKCKSPAHSAKIYAQGAVPPPNALLLCILCLWYPLSFLHSGPHLLPFICVHCHHLSMIITPLHHPHIPYIWPPYTHSNCMSASSQSCPSLYSHIPLSQHDPPLICASHVPAPIDCHLVHVRDWWWKMAAGLTLHVLY